MNAKQAREQALSITNNKNAIEYATIKESIKYAVECGDLECTFFHSIGNSVKEQLTSEGYIISSSSDPREGSVMTTVKW